jgi:hypothetical protein
MFFWWSDVRKMPWWQILLVVIPMLYLMFVIRTCRPENLRNCEEKRNYEKEQIKGIVTGKPDNLRKYQRLAYYNSKDSLTTDILISNPTARKYFDSIQIGDTISYIGSTFTVRGSVNASFEIKFDCKEE